MTVRWRSMKRQFMFTVFLALCLLVLAATGVVLAGRMNAWRSDMSDPGGHLSVTDSDTSALGGFSAPPLSVEPVLSERIMPPGLLTRDDYRTLYAQANGLLSEGVHYRQNEIQVPAEYEPGKVGYVNVVASDTITKALQNYADFNNGVLFYRFFGLRPSFPRGLLPQSKW